MGCAIRGRRLARAANGAEPADPRGTEEGAPADAEPVPADDLRRRGPMPRTVGTAGSTVHSIGRNCGRSGPPSGRLCGSATTRSRQSTDRGRSHPIRGRLNRSWRAGWRKRECGVKLAQARHGRRTGSEPSTFDPRPAGNRRRPRRGLIRQPTVATRALPGGSISRGATAPVLPEAVAPAVAGTAANRPPITSSRGCRAHAHELDCQPGIELCDVGPTLAI